MKEYHVKFTSMQYKHLLLIIILLLTVYGWSLEKELIKKRQKTTFQYVNDFVLRKIHPSIALFSISVRIEDEEKLKVLKIQEEGFHSTNLLHHSIII